MRRAGRVVAEMLEVCAAAAVPGATTAQLGRLADDVLGRRSADSSFKRPLGVNGRYPASICASPNHIVVHGVPNETVLAEGDIISIDAGAVVDGWHADAAVTVAVGVVAMSVERLVESARRALAVGIAAVTVGGRVGDVSAEIERSVVDDGFDVVREYVGHGIGRSLHEPPEVPNWGVAGTGERLRVGMCLAIEPIITAGDAATEPTGDWATKTVDGSWSAHFEHTVAITSNGVEILTTR